MSTSATDNNAEDGKADWPEQCSKHIAHRAEMLSRNLAALACEQEHALERVALLLGTSHQQRDGQSPLGSREAPHGENNDHWQDGCMDDRTMVETKKELFTRSEFARMASLMERIPEYQRKLANIRRTMAQTTAQATRAQRRALLLHRRTSEHVLAEEVRLHKDRVADRALLARGVQSTAANASDSLAIHEAASSIVSPLASESTVDLASSSLAKQQQHLRSDTSTAAIDARVGADKGSGSLSVAPKARAETPALRAKVVKRKMKSKVANLGPAS